MLSAKLFWAIIIISIGLQGCTQTKVVKVPTPLVELNSAYDVELLWQLRGDKISESDVEGLFFAKKDNNLYFANVSGMLTSAFIAPKSRWTEQIEWQRKFNEAIVSGPVISEKGLIIGTAKASLMLLSPTDGSIIWQTKLSSEILSKAVVVIDDIVNYAVFVRTVDGNLYSLNLITGKINWIISHNLPSLSLRGTAPVTYHLGIIYIGWETGRVEAIDALTGQTKWQSQVVIPRGRTDLERLVDIQAQLIMQDGRLYVFGYQGRLASLNPQNGNLFWIKEVSGTQDFVLDDKALYLIDENDILKAYSLNNGTLLWKQENFKYRQLVDLISFDKNQLLLADGQGFFHWVDKLSGTQLARAKHIEIGKAGQQIIRVKTVNNKIFTLDSQGYVSTYKVIKNK